VYWSQWLTVTKGTTEATAIELEAKLTVGMIEEVKVFFPPGCLGYVKCKLYHFEHQILPSHPQGYISGDDYVFVFPMDYEIKSPPAKIMVRAWNTAEVYDHTIMIGIFLREKAPGGLLGTARKVLGMSE